MRRIGIALRAAHICLALALCCAIYGAPSVNKVEPPNWWMGLSAKPLRLLIHGSGLRGCRLISDDRGIVVGRSRVNDAGTYLFADVTVRLSGKHALRVSGPGGTAKVPWEVLPPPARAGRFQGFSPDDLIYLVMLDRFANGDPSNDNPAISKGLFDRKKPRYYHGGDFQGIVDRLPYLKDLGVTALWLNPIYDNVNHLNYKEDPARPPVADYHGYGAIDFYGVEEHFGDLKKFQQLSAAAHDSGIKLILDMVANHTSPYHPWVADPPLPDWFHGSAAGHLTESWQRWTLLSPRFSPELQRSTLDGWFNDVLPDLNQDEPEVERYLIQNTLWWIAASGIDGIREDTLPYVPRKFWRDWSAAIKRDFPHVRIAGEVFDEDPALVSFFQGGKARFDGIDTGIDSLFDFPQYFAIRSALAQGGSMEALGSVLAHDSLYQNPSNLVTFLGLHDVKRFMSEKGATFARLRLAFSYLMTTRGIPMVYYGDEIGMHGGDDPDNRRDFPGGWPGDAKNKFEPAARTGDEHTLFAHVRRLQELRMQFPALRHGSPMLLAANPKVLSFARVDPSQSVIVTINNSAATQSIEVDASAAHFREGDQLRDLFGVAPNLTVHNGRIQIRLEPESAALYAH